MSTKKNDIVQDEANVDLQKREFMGKVGKYAAVGAGMATLMTPTLSTAGNYCYKTRSPEGYNGWSDGYKKAPVRSRYYGKTKNKNGWRDGDKDASESSRYYSKMENKYKRVHRKYGPSRPD